MKTKICTACKKELTLDNYYIRTNEKRSVYSYCKKCSSKKVSAAYKKRISKIEYEPPKIMPVTDFERALQIGASYASA